MIVDGDGHLYESPDMWSRYTTRRGQDFVLRVEEDQLGYSWLTYRGESTGIMAWVTEPGDFDRIGDLRRNWREGSPCSEPSFEALPKDRWQPRARADLLTSWGIDQGVLFPQYGIMWEYQLADDLEATRLNMAAWNRWAVDIVNEGAGRLIPVGHLTLQGDVAWVRDQLAALSAGGVRLAMFAPVLANGKRLSHPDHDEIWELFLRYDVIPTWHIGSGMMDVLSDYEAWCDNDPESNMKLVPALFQGSAAHIGLTDMAMNGVFERYPELHLFLAELGVDWWSRLLTRMDRVYSQYTSIHGKIFNPALKLRPSEYIERNVLLVCSGGAASDLDSTLVARFPESFAFGGDFPHPEGLSNALVNYRRQIGPLDNAIGEGFYGANVMRLLRSI